MQDELGGHPGGVLWAIGFVDGRVAGSRDQRDAASPDWTWTHFALGDVRARSRLQAMPETPARFRELLQDDDDRVQLHAEAGWTFGVLPDMERNLAGEVSGAGRLYFACDTTQFLSARLHALRVVDDVRRAVEQGQRTLSPVHLASALIGGFVELVALRLERLTQQIDALEDEVLAEPSDPGELQLGPLRRELAKHRRELQALRGGFARSRLGAEAREGAAGLEELGRRAGFVEALDRDAAELLDRARLLHEEIDTLITAATNRGIRTLTVISTLLIPATLVVGAFGMNVRGVPFANSPAGFAVALLICLGVGGAALVLLRRLRVLS